jgi:hypothetical protein
MRQDDLKSVLLGYAGSVGSAGSGIYMLAEQVQTALGLLAVLVGLIGGVLTVIHQWRKVRDYKRPTP